MEEQKVIITKTESEINREIENGWSIKSVTAQHVASGTYATEGQFLILLYKPLEIL